MAITSGKGKVTGIREQVSFDRDQRALSRHLLKKSGVDFAKLNRRELIDAASGLISPFDYGLWALAGLLSGTGVVWSLWVFVVAPESSGGGVAAAIALLFAIGFGCYTAACAIAVFVYRSIRTVVSEGFRSVDEVKREIANVSPSALKQLSAEEVAKGTIWLMFVPAIEVVLRRRLKLRALSWPAGATIRKAFRLVAPPEIASDSPGVASAEERTGAKAVPRTGGAEEAIGDGSASRAATISRRLDMVIGRVGRFGAIVFGGLAILQLVLLVGLALLVRGIV